MTTAIFAAAANQAAQTVVQDLATDNVRQISLADFLAKANESSNVEEEENSEDKKEIEHQAQSKKEFKFTIDEAEEGEGVLK